MSTPRPIDDLLRDAREAYGAFGRAEKALGIVDRALGREPENVEALNLKAALLFDLDRDDEARVLHEQALALNPHSVEALHGLASIANGIEHYAEALVLLARAFAAVEKDTSPEFVENEDYRQRLLGQLYVEKAFALWYSGDEDAATAVLTAAGPAACPLEVETFEDELAWLEAHPDEPE